MLNNLGQRGQHLNNFSWKTSSGFIILLTSTVWIIQQVNNPLICKTSPQFFHGDSMRFSVVLKSQHLLSTKFLIPTLQLSRKRRIHFGWHDLFLLKLRYFQKSLFTLESSKTMFNVISSSFIDYLQYLFFTFLKISGVIQTIQSIKIIN